MGSRLPALPVRSEEDSDIGLSQCGISAVALPSFFLFFPLLLFLSLSLSLSDSFFRYLSQLRIPERFRRKKKRKKKKKKKKEKEKTLNFDTCTKVLQSISNLFPTFPLLTICFRYIQSSVYVCVYVRVRVCECG